MGCRGICSEYSEKKINPKGSGMYNLGYKRCTVCECFMKREGKNCPCCGYRLRTKPKNTIGRKNLKDRKNLKEFQTKLNLSQESADYSKQLFCMLKKKIPYKFQSSNSLMATCVFIACRFKDQPRSVEQISKIFDVNKEILEFTCDLSLEEIKTALVLS